jgi:hypothetical protein
MKNTNVGGVSYETSSNTYRGSINLGGQRFKTKRYPTRIGAKRALTNLIKTLKNINT